jgi:hypothetical protein
LCAFSLNRANGCVFPATEYLGSFPLPNIGVAARVFSKAFAFFGTGTSESGAKLSDLSPWCSISRIDARLDSWFDFLLLELGSEDSAADFRTTRMGPYDSQRMMRGKADTSQVMLSTVKRLRGKIYKRLPRLATKLVSKQRDVKQASYRC